MFQSILIEMRSRVRAGQMTLTTHAREELYNDRLTTDDLAHGFLSGALVERQWDEDWQVWKYVIAAETLEDGRWRSWQDWAIATTLW